MTEREQFLMLLAVQTLSSADAILLFAGDGFNRIGHVAELVNKGHAPRVAVVSADTRYEYGSQPASRLAQALTESGVPSDAIHKEETALNTKEEAERFVALAQERGWRKLLLVTSPHHAARVFLTMLKSAAGMELYLIPTTPVLLWFEENKWGRRADLLAQELERIEAYQQKGDVASYREGIDYLQWQESHQ